MNNQLHGRCNFVRNSTLAAQDRLAHFGGVEIKKSYYLLWTEMLQPYINLLLSHSLPDLFIYLFQASGSRRMFTHRISSR